MRSIRLPLILLLLLAPIAAAGTAEPPSFAIWSKIELAFPGPPSHGRGDPNPFAVQFDVTFTSPRGKAYRVPGFYAGDGHGGMDGDRWKVRFAAHQAGRWTYRTSSSAGKLNGKTGQFTVTPTLPGAKGFWKLGRLQYVGTADNAIRYLKFRDGPYWLKAGCDDPENFLGNSRNYNTLAKRKAAVDYLAARGINSLYMMTHNIDGDDRDVWPWLGSTAAEAKANAGKDARFDIAKLDQWHRLLEHMQNQGVVPYLVLEDDSAWTGYDQRRYYREMIARFGYLPALLFNLGEESNENYSLPEALDKLRQLREIDPYRHPCGIHNVNRPNDAYIRCPATDFTAIQTGSPGTRRDLESALEHNQIAIDWIRRCNGIGQRVLMVGFDEGRPEEDRRAWWSAYLGGGVWEAHIRQPYDRPMRASEPVWTELGGTRTFMESLPFWDLQPRNDLVKSGRGFCLARPGKVYACYLPVGGRIEVDLVSGRTYRAAWWKPTNGRDGSFQDERQVGGGRQAFTAPGPGDWALRIESM
jgi:hypothetical protein